MNAKRTALRTYPSSGGSTLVIVIAAVAIASLIAGSYLLFIDDHRERSAREGDDAATQSRLEQNVLRIQQEIRQLAKTKGKIDLTEISSYLASTADSEPSTDLLKLTLDGYGEGVASLESFAAPSVSLSSLDNQGDPFLGAKASVLSVGVESSAVTSVISQSRLSSKKVVVTPRIDVRGIPVSQFTVFAFGASVDIGSANFAGPIGRIYAQSDIRLSGSLSTSYPVVSGGNVYTAGLLTVSLDGNMPIQFSDEQTAYAQPSDSNQAAWLAEAKTQYNSAIINPGSIPVSLSLAPAGDGANSATAVNEISGLDLITIQNRCDLLLLVRPGSRGTYRIAALRGDSTWLLSNGQHERARAAADSHSMANGKPASAAGTGWQNNPFVAKRVKMSENNGQVVVAFNYGALGQEARQRIHAIFLEFDRSISDAAVLIRGARYLESGLTIASRWPILIAGDFNSGPNPVPASILTTQNVRSVDSAWGNATFGSAP
jgi:hypothetical protein